MDFKTACEKQKLLEKLEKENLAKNKLVEKVLKALDTAHTEADEKLEELAKCCCDKESDVR